VREGSFEDVTTEAVRKDVRQLIAAIVPEAVVMLEHKPEAPYVPGAYLYNTGYIRITRFFIAPGEGVHEILARAATTYRQKSKELRGCVIVEEPGNNEYSAIRLQGDHVEGPLFAVVIPWDQDAAGRVVTAPSPMIMPGSWGVFD
jgi:hypothetical protein